MRQKVLLLWDNPLNGFVMAVVSLVLFALGLSVLRMFITASTEFWYLIWNLFLAIIPLVFAYLLYINTKKGMVCSWKNGFLFGLWLLFLPNAFYLVSDFVHLLESSQEMLLYDVVLFSAYAILGFVLGFISLGLIHFRFRQRSRQLSNFVVFGSLFLCGYAIYLGRYLRWNSWDVVTNPFGIVFDVSRSIIDVSEYSKSLGTTVLFFVFLSCLYFVIWKAYLFAHATAKR
ncbi:DUF1361 domain-containing protein [Candidatus Saccharibacteria bacterium]|nr:DUF1361 domain-containing protein [Candidatus Saccharibacteria bacterium]